MRFGARHAPFYEPNRQNDSDKSKITVHAQKKLGSPHSFVYFWFDVSSRQGRHEMTDRNSIPGRITTRSWAAVTSLGFGLAFLSFIPGMLVMDLFLPSGLTRSGLVPNAGSIGSRSPSRLARSTNVPVLVPNASGLSRCGSGSLWQYRRLGAVAAAARLCSDAALGRCHGDGVRRDSLLRDCGTPRRRRSSPGPSEPLMISIGGSTIAGLAQWLLQTAPTWRPRNSVAGVLDCRGCCGRRGRGCCGDGLGESNTGFNRSDVDRRDGAGCALEHDALDAWLGHGRHSGGDQCASAHLLARCRDI